MSNLTFGNCAAILRANGYAPAPLDSSSRPYGPYAVMQINYSQDIYSEDAIGVLTSVPVARSKHDPIQDHRAIALVVLSVRANTAALEFDSTIARFIEKKFCPVRVCSDSTSHYVFALEGESHVTKQTADVEPIGSAGICSYGSFIELGAPRRFAVPVYAYSDTDKRSSGARSSSRRSSTRCFFRAPYGGSANAPRQPQR